MAKDVREILGNVNQEKIDPNTPRDLLADAPQQAGYSIPDIFKMITGAPTEKLLDIINAYGAGAGQSLMTAETGIENLGNWAQGLPKKQTPSFAAGLAPSVQQGIAQHPNIERAGEFLNPYIAAAPEAALGKWIGLGAKGAGLASRLGEKALSGAATGGLYGALFSPQDQGMGAAAGAGVGSLLSTAFGAPGAIMGSALSKIATQAGRPGSIVRSPEEVRKIASMIPAGLKPNLGDLTNYYPLSRLYHDVAANIPFSGAATKGSEILDKGRELKQNIIDSLTPEGVTPDQHENFILSHLKNLEETVQDTKKQKYDDLYNLADGLGINVKTNNLVDKANEFLKLYPGAKEDPLANISVNSDVMKVLNDISEKGVQEIPANKVSALNINYHNAIKKYSNDTGQSKNILMALQQSLKNDFDEASVVPEADFASLRPKMMDADRYYQENVVPFNDSRSIQNLITDKTYPNDIDKTLLNRGNAYFLENLPKEAQNSVILKALNRKAKRNLDGLTPNQMESFFDDNIPEHAKQIIYQNNPGLSEKLDNLKLLNQISEEPGLKEKRVKTGFSKIGEKLKNYPLMAALLGSATSLTAPHIGVPVMLSGLGQIAGGKVLESLLTSNALRNAYINQQVPKLLGGFGKYPGLLGGTTVGSILNNR